MKNENLSNKQDTDPPQDSDQERFPIRVLSEKSAVSSSTLRAWERRYGLLHPERTPKGHRLYSNSDIQRVLRILDLLNDGHSLPEIAEMLSVLSKTSEETSGINNVSKKDAGEITIWDTLIKNTIEAVSDFNIERIDSIYNESSSLYPVDLVTDRLIQPVIEFLGSAWKSHPERGIAEEHFYTSWLKHRLGARFHHAYTQAKGARIICACVPGSYHEIGLMLFSLSALARGYRVLYFGADLPLDQLIYVTQRSAAKAIVLSAQTQMDKGVNDQLAELLENIQTPVFMGGSNNQFDKVKFEQAKGILLGSKISVALKVFESHIPPHWRSK